MSDPYEVPKQPELFLSTGTESEADCLKQILESLDRIGWHSSQPTP